MEQAAEDQVNFARLVLELAPSHLLAAKVAPYFDPEGHVEKREKDVSSVNSVEQIQAIARAVFGALWARRVIGDSQ